MTSNTGSFIPYQFSGNTGNKSRMAGDYLADFTKQTGSNLGNVLGYKDKEDASTSTNRSSSSQPVSKSSPVSNLNKTLGNTGGETERTFNGGGTGPSSSASSDKTIDSNQPAYLSNELYLKNQKIIANYKGENGATSTKSGAAYNSDLMSGLSYDRAVRTNKQLEDQYATQQSIKAGNDHGSGDYKAPKTKDYYDYLKTYDGPRSYQDVVNTNQSSAIQMGLDKSEPRAYDVWSKWEKDTEAYNKAWNS